MVNVARGIASSQISTGKEMGSESMVVHCCGNVNISAIMHVNHFLIKRIYQCSTDYYHRSRSQY